MAGMTEIITPKRQAETHSSAERIGCRAGALVFEARSGSTLLVRVEDVVLRLHWRMARVSAV